MRWFELFCDALACDDVFRAQVSDQLGRQFRDATGLSLDQFVLVPPPGGQKDISFQADGSVHVSIDLVAADAMGFPVSIAWRCAGHERMLPSDAAARGASIEAWWRELPEADLRKRYGGRTGPPWPASAEFPMDDGRYSFAIEWRPFAWPDLWLEIESGRAVFPARSAVLVQAMEAARQSWNEAAQAESERGLIHNLGTQLEVKSPHAAAINVDFGSASPKALIGMLDAIEGVTGELCIRRVLCRSPIDGRPNRTR
jgi:hypothetical protein